MYGRRLGLYFLLLILTPSRLLRTITQTPFSRRPKLQIHDEAKKQSLHIVLHVQSSVYFEQIKYLSNEVRIY